MLQIPKLRLFTRFKSPWFYWYTGHRRIAVLSLLLSSAVLWVGVVIVAGFSVWAIMLALLLDAAGFWLALVYLLFVRSYLPAWAGLRDGVDAFIAWEVAVPILLGFFVSRLVSFGVAKACGYSVFPSSLDKPSS